MKALATTLLLICAAPVWAQEQDIRATITAQMQAFAERDVAAAFSHASPMIRGIFGSPQNFGAMVQQGYPMVWNNEETRFLDLRERGGQLWQQVMIRASDGSFHMLDYAMVETENGWQINGVELLPPPDLGV